MNPNRIALTFNKQHILATQAKDDSEHIASAFDFLTQTQDENPLVSAYKLGLRHRFMNDTGSGERAIDLIKEANPNHADSYLQAIRQTLAWLNVIEMVNELPAWADIKSTWYRDTLPPILDDLNHPPDSATLLDKFWLGALNIGAGIVLDDESIFAVGQATYEDAVANHIHPEGYLKGLVDEEEATNTFYKQVSGTAALTLMAEMAEHAEVDLWSLNNRGVTTITAGAYTVYYFYYPEKWKWEDGLKAETVEAIMKDEGAFIEIIHRRNPLRAIEQLFEDLRPMFSVYAGGLTTLTHGTSAPRKKKRWSLFGG